MRFFLFSLLLALSSVTLLHAQCGVPISTFPYNENFELGQGGWVAGGNASDWTWGTPTKPVINSAGTGTKCWVVGGLTTSFYNFGERSFVESPCFDFTSLAHPYIQFKIWWESERRFDGGNLQYSLDQGTTWINVGTNTDPVDCLNDNWYNYNSITNLNNLVTVRQGWSGNIQPTAGSCQGGFGSAGWVLAKHCMPYLANVPSVKFRFTFGAGTTCNDYDGMGFDDLTIQNAPVITPDFSSVCNGNNTFTFTDNSNNCPDSWSWNFGDPGSGAANTSTVQNPTHTYNTPGTYTVKLTAGSTCSGMFPITKTVTILGATSSSTQVSCPGGTDGSASVVVSPAGGSPTFQWNTTPPQTGSTATNLMAGTYTVFVNQAGSCPLTTVVFVTERPALNPTVNTVAATCGQSNGSATISVTGGTPNYTYTWSPNVSSSASAANLAPGPYTVTVTDQKNCTKSVTFTVASITPPVIVPDFSAVCNGNNTFSFTDNSTNNPTTWSWNFGDPGSGAANTSALQNPTHTFSTPGTYSVTMIASNACSGNATFSRNVTILGVTSSSTQVSCNGGNNGTATVVVSPAGGNPTFNWNTTPPQTGSTATNLTAGNYTVFVNQVGSCPLTTVVFVTQPTLLNASVATTPANCGQSNGTATITPTGGTPGYTYAWAPGAGNGSTANNLAPGPYNVTITDTKSCTKILQFTIANNAGVQLNGSTAQNVLCFGANNGGASINPPTGTGPFVYKWPAGLTATGNTATGLSAGTYVVTVTDAFLCTATTSVVIAQPASALSALGSSVDATCGQNNGTASVVANGGTPGYTYSWTPNVSSSATASNLAPGAYTVVVKDLNNCTTTVNITVNAVTPPVIAPNFSSVCNGNNTFSFTDLSTNTPNIWNWNFGDPSSGAANTSALQNPMHTYSAPGTYTVTLMAGTTCSGMFTFTQTVVILGVTSTSNAVSCNGGSDGTASVVVIPAGGTPTFQWNTTPPKTSSTATNLAAGNYTVIVSQPGSCPLTTVVFVTEPPVLDASVATTATNCGQSNGKALVTVSGGTAPYTYNWSAGAGPGPNPINLAPGAYTVTVSDSKACSKVLQFNITSTGGVQIAGSTSQNVLCFGGATGSATITQPVGNGPFTFSWPAGTPNGNMASGLSAGTYIVTVSDVNQCTVTLPVVIDEPTELLVQSMATSTSCGQDNGKLTLTANGGTPNYSYTWTPNVSTGTTASALAAGTYTVVVADKNNCSKTLNLTVGAVLPPMLSVLDIMDISCAGARDGGISLSVQDGTGPFTFTWSPSVSDTAMAVGLTAGLYAVTVQDAAKCTDTISVNLVAPLPVVTTAYSLGVKCPGETNGQIIVKNTTGGTGLYLYALGQGALGTASTFGNLSSGSYLLETQDANGCTDTDTLVVKTPLNNSVDAGLDTVITQGSSILLEAVVNDPGAIAHYMWQPGASVTCDTCPSTLAIPPNTLEYTVIVTDSNGCVIRDKRKITIRPGKIYVPNVINPETNIDNDRFTLYAESGVSSILVLQIFDRWGDQVFENKNFEPNNAQLGWDGRFRDKPVNPGVYTYLFKLRLIDGIEQVITGSITIVR